MAGYTRLPFYFFSFSQACLCLFYVSALYCAHFLLALFHMGFWICRVWCLAGCLKAEFVIKKSMSIAKVYQSLPILVSLHFYLFLNYSPLPIKRYFPHSFPFHSLLLIYLMCYIVKVVLIVDPARKIVPSHDAYLLRYQY